MSDEELQKFALSVLKKKQQLVTLERTLMMQRLTNELRARRAEQLERLRLWEKEINNVTKGWPPVKIENNVDLEEPPAGFSYMNHCKVVSSSKLCPVKFLTPSCPCNRLAKES